MANLSTQNALSSEDFLRLKKSFFSDSQKPPIQKVPKKKELIFSLLVLILLVFVVVLYLRNFSIIILPRDKPLSPGETIQLLKEKDVAALELMQPNLGSSIVNNIVYLKVPFGKQSGFILNLRDRLDLSDARLVLLVKNPNQNFSVDVILRDMRFFSNAQNPITLQIPKSSVKSAYIKIPIRIARQIDSYLNLFRIGQIRFIFSQQNADLLPILIKNVLVEKGGDI